MTQLPTESPSLEGMDKQLFITQRPHHYRFTGFQIIRCSGEGNYTWIHLNDQKPLLICWTLKKVHARYPQFIRTHKRHLINPLYIDYHEQGPDDNGHKIAFTTLTTGDHIPWSRQRIRERLTQPASRGL